MTAGCPQCPAGRDSKREVIVEEAGEKSRMTVLIAEDSLTQSELLKYMLESQGFDVVVARNGMDALDYLSRHIPAMVVSDIMMPEMDGYELCRRIKSAGATESVPVLLLTKLSEPEDVIQGLECGADGFMTKPYNEENLISRINYILSNAEVRRSQAGEAAIEVVYGGKKHFITSTRIQIFDLLISTYESAVQKTKELEKTVRELKSAHETIRTLKGLIPICAWCKRVLDDKGFWQQLELYVRDHSEADFTHGLCPECKERMYPEFSKKPK